MSPKLNTPVQTQMAVPLYRSSQSVDYGLDGRVEGKPAKRRVFVQTETGCVLGMELDRGDNVHTVKRRLQLSLNVPTDESSLSFGDMILNNDLSSIRNDSPLLLTRNLMHRSSSTPCLSPTGKALQQRDKSGVIEILGRSKLFAGTNELVKDIVKAIKYGVEPIPVNSGLGGAYYFSNLRGESIAIVKPTDEEPFAPNNPKGLVGKALGLPGMKHSVRVGETGYREVAAYLLDHDHFAKVPPTALVKITHSIFNVNDSVNGNKLKNKTVVSKIASLQQFIPHDYDASDHGSSSFPVAAVHRIGILDIRLFNTDRHAGNLLVKKLDGVGEFGQVELIPIDHGLSLPESLEDPYFEWIHWPQASVPFSEDELEYISNLDPVRESEMLRTELPMIREACLRVLVLCTIFLKEAAAFGLCLADIGGMMSREFQDKVEEPSELELICLEARRIIADREIFYTGSGHRGTYSCDLDYEDAVVATTPILSQESLSESSFQYELQGLNGWNPLFKLDESIEESTVDEVPTSEVPTKVHQKQGRDPSTISRLSLSLKKFGFSEKCQRSRSGKQEATYPLDTTFGVRKSAKELLPQTTSFVKLADMNEDEWIMFLDTFVELLFPALVDRKSLSISSRWNQRLGASCQF